MRMRDAEKCGQHGTDLSDEMMLRYSLFEAELVETVPLISIEPPPISTKELRRREPRFRSRSDMPRRTRQASEGRDGRHPFSPFVVALLKSSAGTRAPIADKFAKS
jgi:hypothetical protein